MAGRSTSLTGWRTLQLILIVGATGLVGSAVVRALAARGVHMRALVRSAAKAATIAALGVEAVLGDLAHPASLDVALEGITRALLISSHHPQQVALQSNFVMAARRAGPVHIVKLSGLGTGLESPLQSGRWHAQIEQGIADAGLPFTHLRPLFFMQNLLRSAPDIATHGVLAAAMGEGRIAMVDARDVAAVAIAALTSEGHTGQTYTLTGPEALSFSEVAETLSTATGKRITYHDLSLPTMHQQLVNAGLPEWLIDVRMEFSAVLRDHYAATITNTVTAVTGQAPRSLEAFAQEHAAIFRGASA